jgi:hypothetical protein
MEKGQRDSIGEIRRRRLLEIAIHEAGHLVLAWVTGRKIVRASIVTDAQYAKLRLRPEHGIPAGCTDLAPLPPGIDLTDHRYRVLAGREAMIALAGQLAVIRLRGCRRKEALSQGDLEGLSYAATHAGVSKRGLNSYLDVIASRTALYLDVFWPHVEVLADALLCRRELAGQQVASILRALEGREVARRERASQPAF